MYRLGYTKNNYVENNARRTKKYGNFLGTETRKKLNFLRKHNMGFFFFLKKQPGQENTSQR